MTIEDLERHRRDREAVETAAVKARAAVAKEARKKRAHAGGGVSHFCFFFVFFAFNTARLDHEKVVATT